MRRSCGRLLHLVMRGAFVICECGYNVANSMREEKRVRRRSSSSTATLSSALLCVCLFRVSLSLSLSASLSREPVDERNMGMDGYFWDESTVRVSCGSPRMNRICKWVDEELDGWFRDTSLCLSLSTSLSVSREPLDGKQGKVCGCYSVTSLNRFLWGQ